MTLPMDMRILSEDAKLGFVFARRGYVNEACSSWFLPRIVGLSKAVEWVTTGRIIGAEEALHSGLVSEVVPHSRVYARALEVARDIRDNTAPVSVALCRQMMYQMAGARHPMTAHKIESSCFYYIGTAPDALEGAASFREKRPPEFKMSPVTDMPPAYPCSLRSLSPRTFRTVSRTSPNPPERSCCRRSDCKLGFPRTTRNLKNGRRMVYVIGQ